SDLSLVMGMLRWILEEERFDADHLARPHAPAAEDEQAASWTNATHLLIAEPGHPAFGRYLRASDLGWETVEDSEPAFIVVDEQNELRAHTELNRAVLFAERAGLLDGQEVRVCTALHMLRERTRAQSLAQYAGRARMEEPGLGALASDFTRNG